METFGNVELPVMTGEPAQLWELILSLADRLAPSQWSLIGGQMVSLYAIHADVEWPRVTRDVDMLANMEVLHSNLAACTTALEKLGLRAQPDSSGAAYRFSNNATANPSALIVDLLAPDHRKPNTRLRTSGGPTIEIAGGTQALQRTGTFNVRTADGRQAQVPVPNLLGAIVLKAAAWAADTRDRQRHAQDVALLTSLIDDPAALVLSFAGSDRKRLFKLREILDERTAQEWLLLGPERSELGHANWTELTSTTRPRSR